MSISLEATMTIADIRALAIAKSGRLQCRIEISATSSPHGFQWTVTIGFFARDPWGTGKFKVFVAGDEDIAVATQKCLAKITPAPDLSEYTGQVRS